MWVLLRETRKGWQEVLRVSWLKIMVFQLVLNKFLLISPSLIAIIASDIWHLRYAITAISRYAVLVFDLVMGLDHARGHLYKSAPVSLLLLILLLSKHFVDLVGRWVCVMVMVVIGV